MLMICICYVFAEEGTSNAISKMERIDKFVNEAPLFINSKSLSQLRHIGILKHESIEHSPNRYDSNKSDEFITLQFDGLTIYAYVKSNDEIWPIHITVTTPKWRILHGLNVGVSDSRITQILGYPTEENKHVRQYIGIKESIVFHIKKARISKIELLYYLD
jgi:hypothetical protein